MSKRYVFVVLSLFLTSTLFAVDVPEWLESLAANAPGAETYPQASVLVLKDDRTISVDSAGASTAYVEQCLKLIDDRAKDEQGDRSIRFDAERDTIIFDEVYTRLPDGSWIEPEQDAFTVTSAPEVQWASAYSQLKQQNVSFPGLAANAVIYWKYRIEPKSGRDPWQDDYIGGIVTFGGFEPVQEQTFTVSSDSSLAVQYEMQNSELKPEVTMDGGRKTLTWKFRNLAQLTPEPNMVSSAHLVPRLVFTSFADWSETDLYVGEKFWKAVESAQLAQLEYSQLASFGSMQGKPLVQNIASWVQQNIRTVNLSLGAVGYTPNDANDVWANRYGDVRDKLVLLSALLGGYGIDSYPVLMQSSDLPFSSLPSLEQFSYMILAVPLDKDTLFLDPIPRFSPPYEIGYSRTLGQACQLVLGAPIIGPANELVRVDRKASTSMSVVLDDTGTLSGRADADAFADYANIARQTFSDQKEQEKEIYFQRAASRIGQGCEVVRTEVSDPEQLTQPMHVSLDFSCKNYAVIQGDLMLVDLPASPFSFAISGFYPSLPEVKYPVNLPLEGTTEMTILVTYPKEYKVSYLPSALLVENPYVKMSLVPKQLADRVEWTQSITYKSSMLPVKDYQSVRESFEKLVAPKNRMMVLEKAE
ncbi:MAG: DUF3857 domain-containing protein [Calditrichaeota bacterium]|nr:DUF3857 domain-containing protein [Calditrichota bacterium]MCB9367994.1 DUF3857 domain-containing protein [Calditrichota bacterium]